MPSIILISSDESLNRDLLGALGNAGSLEIARAFTSYPAFEDLLRTVRVRKPDFLLLDIEDFPNAEALAKQIDDFLPGFPVVAIGRHLELDVMPKLMHLGIREYLAFPINPPRLAEVIESTQQHLRRHPPQIVAPGDLYSFLPAKPGVGASTIAVSTSCALADELGARTLLMDCDLAAGAIRFLLKLGNSGSILDAIRHGSGLDEDMWSQLVGKFDKLEVLHAGELDPCLRIDQASLASVLTMARSQYEVVCADLGSSMDAFSMDLMRESRRIFVVTTPELVPLHLAAHRIRRLTELGFGDRVNLLLNRKTRRKGELPDADVVQAAGLPLAFTFSNDYSIVEKSILQGSPVCQESKLGENILEFAQSLAPHLTPKPATIKRRFLEFFHVPKNVETDDIWQG